LEKKTLNNEIGLYRQFLFYARVTFLKTLCKSNTKSPFKAWYFLGFGGLTISSYIAYDNTTREHTDLWSILVLYI
jgi:hypothetical protein